MSVQHSLEVQLIMTTYARNNHVWVGRFSFWNVSLVLVELDKHSVGPSTTWPSLQRPIRPLFLSLKWVGLLFMACSMHQVHNCWLSIPSKKQLFTCWLSFCSINLWCNCWLLLPQLNEFAIANYPSPQLKGRLSFASA